MSVCADPDPSNGRPAYCSSDFDRTGMCKPYSDALGALWHNMEKEPTVNPILLLPLAHCKNVQSSQVESQQNNGLDITKLKENWATAGSFGSASASGCRATSYGVFNPITGAKVASSYNDLYRDQFADCDASVPGNKAVKPFMDTGGSFTCRTVEFQPRCQNPLKTEYAQCRNPGWDYMPEDTSGSQWSYDFSGGCTKAAFSGQDYQDDPSKHNCTSQCCVYQSITGTDDTTNNCRSCAEAVSDKNYARDWGVGANNLSGKMPSVTFTNANDGAYVVPYCNQAGGSWGTNTQGVAISLRDADTNKNTSQFGNPADCQAGGQFSGMCNGITGCDGLGGFNNEVLKSAPCRLGFSSTNSNPAANCPNIWTIQNTAGSAGASCQTSTKDRRICTPKGVFDGGNCDDPADITQTLVADGGFPRVKQLTIPEGAWVTTYNNARAGATFAPNQSNFALCDPVQFGSTGNEAWTYGCGRDTNGTLVGKSRAVRVSTKGVWTDGTRFTENDTAASAVDEAAQECTFDVDVNTPAYGWQFGFMPGYYNTTCQTNSINECGTIDP